MRFFIFLTFLFLVNCSKGTITGTFKHASIQDFKKSEIISNGPAAADGQSDLLIVIQLTNSDSTPVVGFRPTYTVVSGGGVTALPCTTSNSNGVSTCILRSTQVGVKTILVNNVAIVLKSDVVFTTPMGRSVFGAIAGAKKITSTDSRYELLGNFGNQEPGAVKTSGRYTLKGGVQTQTFQR